MPDYAVFARSVEALKNDEKGMLPFCIHQVLQLFELLNVLLNLRQSLFVGFMFPMVSRVEIFQSNLGAWLDDEFFQVVRHDEFFRLLRLSRRLSLRCQ